MRVRAVGADALLIEVDDPAAWFAELSHRRATGELDAVEIIPGARTVLLDGLADPTAAAERLRGWRPVASPSGAPGADQVESPSGAPGADQVEIPVTFDGEDLPTVAELWGTDPAGVVDRLVATALHVAFCGFTPGWAYLAGLPEELAVPRLPTPRPRVPAGAVALADRYAGIYPTASPGGWRLVGHTDVNLFDPGRTPPALLVPGIRVRLRAAQAPAPGAARAGAAG